MRPITNRKSWRREASAPKDVEKQYVASQPQNQGRFHAGPTLAGTSALLPRRLCLLPLLAKSMWTCRSTPTSMAAKSFFASRAALEIVCGAEPRLKNCNQHQLLTWDHSTGNRLDPLSRADPGGHPCRAHLLYLLSGTTLPSRRIQLH